jgi:hypothetical protein
MRFDHVFESVQAGTALWFIAARAGLIGFRHGTAVFFMAEMFFDLFVAKRMAEANQHG